MALPTLLDIAKANGTDQAVGLLEESIKASPAVRDGLARTIRGINYRTLVRTALPNAQFRQYNDGTDPVKSTWENRLVECFALNPRWECDKAVADSYEFGGAAAYIAIEGQAQTEAAVRRLERQFFYGNVPGTNNTFADAAGHPGLIDMYDATGMVVDATGTDNGAASSVWFVKWGVQNVHWVFGENGTIELPDPRIELIEGANSKKMDGYVQSLLLRVGLQVGTKNDVVRIKNICNQDTKRLTDNLLSQALEKFPSGVTPDVIYMTRRSRGMLQRSRTTYSPTGAPAPLPQEYEGIPIVITDGITDLESTSL